MDLKIELYAIGTGRAESDNLSPDVKEYIAKNLEEVSSFYERYSEGFISDNLVRFLTEDYKSSVSLLVIRDKKDTVLGFTTFSEVDPPGLPSPSCFLRYLFVDPTFRRKSLGKTLVQYLKDKFRSITVFVDEGKEKVKDFYEKQGFQFLGVLPHEPTGKRYWGFIWKRV